MKLFSWLTTWKTKEKLQNRLLSDITTSQIPKIWYLIPLCLPNLFLNIFNGVGAFHLQHASLPCHNLNINLHMITSQPQKQIQCRFFLDFIIVQSLMFIFEVFSAMNKRWWCTWIPYVSWIIAFKLSTCRWAKIGHDGLSY